MLNPIDLIIFIILNALGIVLTFVLFKALWTPIKQVLQNKIITSKIFNKNNSKVDQCLKVIDLEIAKKKKKEKVVIH
jgi:TM2 domain-containing membrane protein YozV